MSTIVSIIIIAAVIIVLIFAWYKEKPSPSRPEFSETDFPLIFNDKSILVEGPNYNEIREVCIEFCEKYNVKQYNVIVKLIRLNPTSTLLIFPYEIDFQHYCYLVNYLKFPIGQNYSADVKGWLTSKKLDEWIDCRSVNKKIMVYNHSDIKYADGVNYTTMDQLGFRINFNEPGKASELEQPVQKYAPFSLKIQELNLSRGEIITSRD